VELILGMEGVIDVVDRLHDDLEVRRSVERALRRSVPSARIRADSYLGRVTLAGRAGSRAERERALTVADSLPGVRSVTDRIEIEATPAAV
jgi:osmotically-inducible protein OsmY